MKKRANEISDSIELSIKRRGETYIPVNSGVFARVLQRSEVLLQIQTFGVISRDFKWQNDPYHFMLFFTWILVFLEKYYLRGKVAIPNFFLLEHKKLSSITNR